MVHIYTDDSGNTGPELLDTNQPFGTTAFVSLDSAAEESIRAAMPALVDGLGKRPRS